MKKDSSQPALAMKHERNIGRRSCSKNKNLKLNEISIQKVKFQYLLVLFIMCLQCHKCTWCFTDDKKTKWKLFRMGTLSTGFSKGHRATFSSAQHSRLGQDIKKC